MKNGFSDQSMIAVGLRGVGKTVLLNAFLATVEITRRDPSRLTRGEAGAVGSHLGYSRRMGISERYEETYEGKDAKFARWRAMSAETKAGRVRNLLPAGTSSIVDIGCGDGALLFELDRHNAASRLVGYEIAQSAVEKVIERGITRVERVESFDGYHLPDENASFDVAVLSHVLEHTERPSALLAEAGRVARTVILEVPLEATVLAHREAYKRAAEKIGHIQKFSLASGRQMIRTAGMEITGEILTGKTREGRLFWAATPGQRAKAEVAWIVSRLLGVVPALSRQILPVNFTARAVRR
jgi:SAM-dependent methyltransferase